MTRKNNLTALEICIINLHFCSQIYDFLLFWENLVYHFHQLEYLLIQYIFLKFIKVAHTNHLD
jgi:hypothetical protein